MAPACACCGEPLETPTRGPVCAACWTSIAVLTPPLCAVCGDPLPSSTSGLALPFESDPSLAESGRTSDGALLVCPRCVHRSFPIVRSRAIGDYAGALRSIIHVLKYDKRPSIAPRLAAMMAAGGQDVLQGADAAVPVPLHWIRGWQRGFNQASLLACHLGIPVWSALKRRRFTRPQVALTAAARRHNVRNAFALARRGWPWRPSWSARLKGRKVVLVDDVCTTGATLEACARVLLKAGVTEVRALTAARVVRR